ncbi:MAG: phosphoglucosamine mutase [Acidimicrobiales bacterium]
MAVRFGTDGIRGRAYEEVSEDLAYRLGRAVATVFAAPAVVGYDTRESSWPLAAAVLAGLRDGGARADDLGVLPTPGVAALARERAAVGIVVSASHNPYRDNGLKVFGSGGAKLDLATEATLAAALEQAAGPDQAIIVAHRPDQGAAEVYLNVLRSLVRVPASGLHVVVDCANGAASGAAPALLASVGARVTAIHDQPDGRNINAHCGSTDVADLVVTVRHLGADLGLALDGDGDRLIAVDRTGTVRDGDDLLVLFAQDLAARGELGGGVVVTTMANLGLHHALSAAGIEVATCDVGDRHVLAELERRRWRLGGEQSGHLIFADLAPTGDGLLTGLRLLELVARRGPLDELAAQSWQRVPQALVNVARDAFDPARVERLRASLEQRFHLSPDDWRLVVRPSGTEPVVRIMIESLRPEVVEEFTAEVVAAFGIVAGGVARGAE